MVYNSLTFQKEEFKTIKPNEVLMYVCGPTVYDSPHLGHAKSAVAFDLVHRYLKFKGYNVKLVKNYTDIDDKIIKRANERNIDFNTLCEQYIKEYEDIMNALNVEKDYMNPRATETIDFMIEVIQGLIKNEHAYERNGSVYYSVKTFPKYDSIFQNVKAGELHDDNEDIEDQDIAYGDDKEDRRDFALWKKHKEGEPYWESPWGKGRPGWHIECSSMSVNILGETLDIHGGGQDLKFPHHRNEIAQSEGYTGKKFANYFMHNGFVNIDDEKMSKSLGNFFLVSEVIKNYDPMVIRLFLFSSHYRSSINYSLDNMNQAQKNYNRLLSTIRNIHELNIQDISSKNIKELILEIEKAEKSIIKAMDDDFNTPIALAEFLRLFRVINREVLENKLPINKDFKDKFFNFVDNMNKIFGLFPNLKSQLALGDEVSLDEKGSTIQNLLKIIYDVRAELRTRKIYDLSDNIRDKLKELGINVEDK
ncbi:MAG: cysteine--tRNA ligase [Promethearchaeota archaeon]|nr:MAG: cysteine--tRNA ligase [Candidatus Lokiarchaeota archaeon]